MRVAAALYRLLRAASASEIIIAGRGARLGEEGP